MFPIACKSGLTVSGGGTDLFRNVPGSKWRLLSNVAEEACPAGLHHSGFSCGNHQPKIFLNTQTFRQLAAAFISGSGLQSVHVLNV